MTVTILMATFNGAAHLPAQLQSFLTLRHQDWSLWASDDASTDATTALLAAFSRDAGHPVRLLSGPRHGIAANFLSMLRHPELPDGAVALSDQDDVWFPERLGRALEMLEAVGSGPRLYCSRTAIGTDPAARLRISPLHPRPPSLRNALVQSIGGGNTMVLSPELVAALRGFDPGPPPLYHDWWLYQAVMAIGGTMIYDPRPSLFYRQHSSNTFGRNRGIGARWRRTAMLWDGRFSSWINANLAALEAGGDRLTDEARGLIADFRALRRMRGPAAITEFRRLGLYRQHHWETVLLMSVAATGRL